LVGGVLVADLALDAPGQPQISNNFQWCSAMGLRQTGANRPQLFISSRRLKASEHSSFFTIKP